MIDGQLYIRWSPHGKEEGEEKDRVKEAEVEDWGGEREEEGGNLKR